MDPNKKYLKVPDQAYMVDVLIFPTSGSYLDLLLGGGATEFFSLIEAQNLQVKFLVIFKSGDSLTFVVFFFFYNLMPVHLQSTFV
jgi:hypothetical protein